MKESSPRVSLITAVLNARSELPGAVESFLAFAPPEVEWCLVDGASTDGTLEILRALRDPRIRWWSEPDRGLYEAMNKGVERMRGRWCYFWGADDRLLPGFAELAGRLADPDTIYYGDVRLASDGRRYAGPFDAAKLARTNICHQAIIYPRRAFDGRRFDLRYRTQADWEFNMRCWSDPSLKFHYVDVVVACYNDRGRSAQAEDFAFYMDYGKLLRRHFTWRTAFFPLARWGLSRAWRALTPGRPRIPRPLR